MLLRSLHKFFFVLQSWFLLVILTALLQSLVKPKKHSDQWWNSTHRYVLQCAAEKEKSAKLYGQIYPLIYTPRFFLFHYRNSMGTWFSNSVFNCFFPETYQFILARANPYFWLFAFEEASLGGNTKLIYEKIQACQLDPKIEYVLFDNTNPTWIHRRRQGRDTENEPQPEMW